jgi:hypothetical protein
MKKEMKKLNPSKNNATTVACMLKNESPIYSGKNRATDT